LKHGKLLTANYCGGLITAYCGGGVRARLNCCCYAAVVVVAARIAAVGIVGDGPNYAAVVVDAADHQVGYTPCGTSEEYH
jgi:hypothetical protein